MGERLHAHAPDDGEAGRMIRQIADVRSERQANRRLDRPPIGAHEELIARLNPGLAEVAVRERAGIPRIEAQQDGSELMSKRPGRKRRPLPLTDVVPPLSVVDENLLSEEFTNDEIDP